MNYALKIIGALQIRIQGKRLRIQYYTNDEMKVTGALSSLEFTEGRNPG